MVLSFLQRRAPEKKQSQRPVLDLSGPKLRRAMEHLVESAEQTGGVEKYVSALILKASLFEEILGKGKVREMEVKEFEDLAAFISPVRRRVGPYVADDKFHMLREQLALLLEGWSDLDTADARLLRFMAAFPRDKAHRWVRDLGAEVLHFTAPEHYPLMTRWMWDKRVDSGVLREIWFTEKPGQDAELDADDDFATFSVLYEELTHFLSENGVFRDHTFYIDLLCAHVYADYINDQGGAYLRNDFSDGSDPMLHTRRMLGLDAINTETGRSRLKLIDGDSHVFGGQTMMLS